MKGNKLMELYTAFMQAAQHFSESVAFEWESETLSYNELLNQSNIVGNYLKNQFSAPAQNVGLLAPNTFNFPRALFGILGSGHIAVPLNPLLNPEEIALLLTHSESPAVLYDPVMYDQIQAAKTLMERNIQTIPINQILQTEPIDSSVLSPLTASEYVSMILYTSGTTGDPKGVMLSHQNIYSNYDAFTTILDFNQDDTFLCFLPLFHTYAMTVILFGALLKGSRVILYPQFNLQKVIEHIVSRQSIVIVAVPPMIHIIAKFTPNETAERHNIRFLVSGGGPLPVDVNLAFQKKFSHEVLEGYGLTEASPVIATNRPTQNKIGTIGPPLPGIEAEIRDEQGNILGVGEIGELCVRGDNVMLGYYKNPEATKSSFYENDWLRTGDMACIDDNGYLKIVGRLKDLIVCGGENIYPREIEEILLRYPGVAEAAVVGKPSKLRSEVPHAFIVLSEESIGKINESDLRRHCREHLAEYKIPEGFTFIEQMPKTATKKIRKEEIKRLYFN